MVCGNGQNWCCVCLIPGIHRCEYNPLPNTGCPVEMARDFEADPNRSRAGSGCAASLWAPPASKGASIQASLASPAAAAAPTLHPR